MKKKLYRSSTDKMICGVLAGFAEYIDVDPTIVRLVYAALTLFTAGFPGILFYIICAIVIPQKPFLNRIKKYFRSHLATVISPRLGYNLLKCVFYADYNKAW